MSEPITADWTADGMTLHLGERGAGWVGLHNETLAAHIAAAHNEAMAALRRAAGLDPNWRTALLNDRQQKELAFSELYVRDFNHGATGHNLYVIVARLADLLDVAAGAKQLPPPPEGSDLVLTFGKYRDQRLAEVYRRDPGYVEWLAREGRDQDVRAAAAALLIPPGQHSLFDEPPPSVPPPPGEEDDLL